MNTAVKNWGVEGTCHFMHWTEDIRGKMGMLRKQRQKREAERSCFDHEKTVRMQGTNTYEKQASLILMVIEQLVFWRGSHFSVSPHCVILNEKPTFHYQQPTLAFLMSVRLNLRSPVITQNWAQNNTKVLLIASHQRLAVSCLSADSLESIQFSTPSPTGSNFSEVIDCDLTFKEHMTTVT